MKADTPDDFMADVRKKFDRAAEKEIDNRERALDDIKFARLGEQWPAAVKAMRDNDHRPCLVKNRMPANIRHVVNQVRENRPSINVIPADSNADVATAEIISGLIRNIEVTSDADIAYDTAVESAVTGGFGYFRINTAYTSDDTFDQDIIIERIPDPFRVYADPDADSADGSDWNCAFVVTVLTKDEFAAKYKDSDAVDWEAMPHPWCDGDNVMVAEYWHREDVEGQIVAMSDDTVLTLEDAQERAAELEAMGIEPVGELRTVKRKKVTQYILSGAEVLETVEWPGRYIPIVPVYGEEIFCDGKRHFKSLIHDAKDAQREANFWDSAAAESVALAPKVPFIGPTGAFNTDIEKWSTANDASHAFIEFDGPLAPMRQGNTGPDVAALQRVASSIDDMKAIMGIYDSSLGAKSNETSGVAIGRRQRQSDISTFHFIDNLTRSVRHCGRILIDLLPKVYSTARMVRTLGDDNEPQIAQIAPKDQHQQMQMKAQMEGRELARIFDITAGKYDLVVKTGPGYGTQREEARQQIVEIIRGFPAAAPILGPMFLRNSDWPGAEGAADKMEKMSQPQPGGDPGQAQQAQAQMQQMAQGLQQMQQQIGQLETENRELKMGAQLKMYELQIKDKEAGIKAQEVDVKRLTAQNSAREVPQPSNPFGLG